MFEGQSLGGNDDDDGIVLVVPGRVITLASLGLSLCLCTALHFDMCATRFYTTFLVLETHRPLSLKAIPWCFVVQFKKKRI